MPIDPTLDPLKARLGRLLGARPSSADPAGARRLRTRLEARVEAKSSASGWRAMTLATRLAVAAVAVAGVTVGACQMRAEVDVDMGLRVTLELVPAQDTEAQMRDLGAALEELTAQSRPPAATEHLARVEIRAELHDSSAAQSSTPRLRVTLDLWAPGLREADVVSTVEATLPEAEIQDLQRIEGAVQTTVGDRFAHELFDAELDSEDVAAAKTRILADLEARGVDTRDAQVEIRDHDGHREIEVRVQREQSDDVGHEIE